MKKLIILGIFFVTTLCFAQEQRVYYNDEGHFSFAIPEGWEEFPKEELDAWSNTASQNSGKSIRYVTAFRKVGGEIDRPIMMMQIDHDGRWSEDDIYKMLPPQKQQEITNKAKKGLKNIQYVEFGKLAYDEENNILFQKQAGTVDGIKQTTMTAMFMYKYGFVTLSMTSLEEEFDADVDDFDVMIESFKFDKGYEY